MWALFANAGGDLVLNGHAHANVEYKPMDASLLTGQPGSHMVDLIAGSSGDVLGSGGTDPRLAWKPQVKTIAVLYLTLNGAANDGIATSISWVYRHSPEPCSGPARSTAAGAAEGTRPPRTRR